MRDPAHTTCVAESIVGATHRWHSGTVYKGGVLTTKPLRIQGELCAHDPLHTDVQGLRRKTGNHSESC